MYYKDRIDAAKRLVPFLLKYKGQDGIVLAIPRGGVPLGVYIAGQLNFPLDIMLVKKIGHPVNTEYAIGAVSLENEIILDRKGIPEDYLLAEIARIRESLKQRYKRFVGDRESFSVENKIVIVVDDGIATGSTIIAGVKMLRKHHPKKIVVAVPVAPPQSIVKINDEVDELICPETPQDFYGVGQFYDDFSEVTDDHVLELLDDIYKNKIS